MNKIELNQMINIVIPSFNDSSYINFNNYWKENKNVYKIMFKLTNNELDYLKEKLNFKVNLCLN